MSKVLVDALIHDVVLESLPEKGGTARNGAIKKKAVFRARSTADPLWLGEAKMRERRTGKSSGCISWGRNGKAGTMLSILSGFMMFFFCPFVVCFFWVTCQHYKGSLRDSIVDIFYHRNASLVALLPRPTFEGFVFYSLWWLAQVALALWVPGPTASGQITPAGHKLRYRVNGLRAWIITHVAFVLLSFGLGWFSPTIVYDNWGAILVCATLYGYALTAFAYIKAVYFPTHPEDRKFSGSFLYDLFMGVELNPRVGGLDLKLFHNGRIGIVLWTLVNLSFAAKQYQRIGYVTNSMVLLNGLHMLYVVDFFYNEHWYLRTIDIAHDHFGYYLCFGDAVWLPFMYPMQSFFLVQSPVDLSYFSCVLVCALGLGGYYIFRSANNQKDGFRRSGGKSPVWGESPEFIEAEYVTADGEKRKSLLLTSGWWGLSRHANYIGDIMMSLSFCMTCGFTHLLPYFYVVYMAILLLHRSHRDDTRCRGKYGKYWDAYCKKVPYKILPGIY